MKSEKGPTSIVSVILSGGPGSRLWPLSRESRPKPFIKLPDGESFLQKTFARASTMAPVDEILTVTHHDLYFQVVDEYKNHSSVSSLIKTSYLLEPKARNTGPAIISAVLYLKERYSPDTVLFILPSDHIVKDHIAFTNAAKEASLLAKEGHLVTFGIKPTHPETGYGYIEVDESPALNGPGASLHRLLGKRFIEKPDSKSALYYMNSNTYFWNSGMFCFTIDTFLKEINEYAPGLLSLVGQSFIASSQVLPAANQYFLLDEGAYSQLPNISIDYALMEKSKRIAVVVGDFGWSDIGSWAAMSALVDKDEFGNHMYGKGVLHDTTDCYIHSLNRTVGTVGLNNLVIVDMPDALLIASRDRTQEVKQVVEHLKTNNDKSLQQHPTVCRPWGHYTVLEEGKGYKIKEVRVKAKSALSLQMHHHRSEHWIVISGTAKVTNGGSTFFLKKDESTFIPAKHRHRLENPDDQEELVIIEVQSGHYLEEDDIVRFDDFYGRVS